MSPINIVLAVRLATWMVEVGVGWRAPQQAPPIKFFYFLLYSVVEVEAAVVVVSALGGSTCQGQHA